MKLPPPAVLATWPPPNYINPQTRGPSLVILNAVFLGLATVILILRLYTRLFIRKWFGLDDILICLAFASTVALNAIVDIGTTKYGWNRHVYDIPLDIATTSLKIGYVAKLLFLLSSVFTAFSLLAFYYRLISESGSHWFRRVLHFSVVFNLVAWLPFLITQIFVCTPIQAYWSFPEPAGTTCMDEGKVTMAGGVIKTFVDFMITTLPMPLVLSTNMQRRQRYAVAVLFSIGYIVTAAGVVRTYYTYRVFYGPSQDSTWYQYPAFLAATVENNLAIVCACAPTIRPLFPHFFGGPISRFRSWLSSHGSSPAQSTDPSPDDSISKPRRTSRLSQLGSNMRFSTVQPRWYSKSFPSFDDNESDVKLVIQKYDDRHKVIELDHLVEDGKLARKSKDIEDQVGRERSRSVITMGNADVHPFDPRLDGRNSRDHG